MKIFLNTEDLLTKDLYADKIINSKDILSAKENEYEKAYINNSLHCYAAFSEC